MKELTVSLIKELASLYGDSFYILDSDVFESNCINLLSAFRKYYPKTNFAYSYKTNYIPKLGRIVNRLGGYAEVVSEMELGIAKRVGVSPERIVWNGPVKSMEDIERFLLSGGSVNVDNLEEFSKVLDIANRNPESLINLGIRCNYDVGDGVISRFGFDVNSEEIDETFSTIASVKNLHLRNLHGHFAKRHFKYWPAKVRGLLDVYDRVTTVYKLEPECLDFGGGISGIMPDLLREQLMLEEFSFDDYATKSASIFQSYFEDQAARPWLFIEPGTAVAADCMRFICRVESIKTVREKTIITTNGSQKNISNGGINLPLNIISVGEERQYVKNADIAGYTCIESDYLFKNYSGEIGVGDYLVFGSCGSYSVVMKPPFICPNVSVIDISADTVEVIKRKELFDDVLCTYNF